MIIINQMLIKNNKLRRIFKKNVKLKKQKDFKKEYNKNLTFIIINL